MEIPHPLWGGFLVLTSAIAFGALGFALFAELLYIMKKDSRCEFAAFFSTRISVFAMLTSVFTGWGLFGAIIAEGKIRLIEFMILSSTYRTVWDANNFFMFLSFILLLAYYMTWKKLETRKPAHVMLGAMALTSHFAVLVLMGYYFALELTPIKGAELYLPLHVVVSSLPLGMFAVATLAGFGYTLSRSPENRFNYDLTGYLASLAGLIFLIFTHSTSYFYIYILQVASPFIPPLLLESTKLGHYTSFYTNLWLTFAGAFACGVANVLLAGGFTYVRQRKLNKLLLPEKVGTPEARWREIAQLLYAVSFACLVAATWTGFYLLWQIY